MIYLIFACHSALSSQPGDEFEANLENNEFVDFKYLALKYRRIIKYDTMIVCLCVMRLVLFLRSIPKLN